MRPLFSSLFILLAFCAMANTASAQQAISSSPRDSIVSAKPTNAESFHWYTMIENIPGDWERWYDFSFRKERVNEWLWIGGLTLATYLTDDMT